MNEGLNLEKKTITLEGWYSSPEKKSVDEKVANKIKQFPEGKIRDMLLQRTSVGKRIRPFLLYAMNNGKIDAETLSSIGSAIELTHQASLIFDDTIDEHYVREGCRESIHALFGNRVEGAGIADHLAEYFLSLNEQSIYELELPDAKKMQIMRQLTEMKQQMVTAQLADKLILEKPQQTSWTQWCLAQSYKKTSGLMAFPFIITGIVQDLNPEERAKFKECGSALGQIYQLYDDLEDIRVGIQAGPISLSYPLAILLDNIQGLGADEQTLLRKITEQRKVLPLDVEKVNKIFHDNIDTINEKIKQETERLTALISLPQGIQGKEEIEKIIKSANNESYWAYKVPRKTN